MAIGPLLTPVTSTLSAFDFDSNNWTVATIRIMANYQNGED